MWYEILPSFGIIVIAMALPTYANYALNNVLLGKSYRRQLLTGDDKKHYLRDLALTGSPYELAGLEAIPDSD